MPYFTSVVGKPAGMASTGALPSASAVVPQFVEVVVIALALTNMPLITSRTSSSSSYQSGKQTIDAIKNNKLFYFSGKHHCTRGYTDDTV